MNLIGVDFKKRLKRRPQGLPKVDKEFRELESGFKLVFDRCSQLSKRDLVNVIKLHHRYIETRVDLEILVNELVVGNNDKEEDRQVIIYEHSTTRTMLQRIIIEVNQVIVKNQLDLLDEDKYNHRYFSINLLDLIDNLKYYHYDLIGMSIEFDESMHRNMYRTYYRELLALSRDYHQILIGLGKIEKPYCKDIQEQLELRKLNLLRQIHSSKLSMYKSIEERTIAYHKYIYGTLDIYREYTSKFQPLNILQNDFSSLRFSYYTDKELEEKYKLIGVKLISTLTLLEQDSLEKYRGSDIKYYTYKELVNEYYGKADITTCEELYVKTITDRLGFRGFTDDMSEALESSVLTIGSYTLK